MKKTTYFVERLINQGCIYKFNNLNRLQKLNQISPLEVEFFTKNDLKVQEKRT
jgi:hypothetical protein